MPEQEVDEVSQVLGWLATLELGLSGKVQREFSPSYIRNEFSPTWNQSSCFLGAANLI